MFEKEKIKLKKRLIHEGLKTIGQKEYRYGHIARRGNWYKFNTKN